MNLRNRLGIVLTICAITATTASAQAFGPIEYNAYTQLTTGGVKTFAVSGSHPDLFEYNPTYRFRYDIGYPLFVTIKSVGTGGGNVFQSDDTWVVDTEGLVYHWNLTIQGWDHILTDARIQTVTAGPGYADSCHPYETWVTLQDAAGWWAERYNYCTKTFETSANNSSVGLSKISTGGGDVWGLNSSNQIFRFNPITNSFVQMTGALAQIAVGVDGVYGLNGNGSVFEFNPISQVFNAISALKLTSISAGGNGIWGVSAGQPYRYMPISRTWVQAKIDSPSTQLSTVVTGTGGGVWALTTYGNIYYYYPQ